MRARVGKQMSYIFVFNDAASTEIYALSLHDALPICVVAFADGRAESPGETRSRVAIRRAGLPAPVLQHRVIGTRTDRKSTRLNSSHANISYAVFCLKKKTINTRPEMTHLTKPPVWLL